MAVISGSTDFERATDRRARAWAGLTRKMLKANASRFRHGKLMGSRVKTVYIPNKRQAKKSFQVREVKLRDSFRYKLVTRRGRAKHIRFDMAYHGFFLERGLGKGRRMPKPWFNPVMERQLPRLADITMTDLADATVNAIRF